jgi:hypothetical protein
MEEDVDVRVLTPSPAPLKIAGQDQWDFSGFRAVPQDSKVKLFVKINNEKRYFETNYREPFLSTLLI